MKTPMLIGLSGRKRSGKDSLALRLMQEHGFERVAFADPMREMALALDPIISTSFVADAEEEERFGFIRSTRLAELVERQGWEAAKEHPEVRRTLQRLGTEAGRGVLGDTIWIGQAFRRINAILARGASVVVTDVRFLNEAERVRQAGGFVLRIERPGLPLGDLHPSETELDGWNGFAEIVLNHHDLDYLHDRADRLPGELARRRLLHR